MRTLAIDLDIRHGADLPVQVTTQVPNGSVVLADWSKVTVCNFVPSQVLVDGFSFGKSIRGDVELIVSNFVDIALAEVDNLVPCHQGRLDDSSGVGVAPLRCCSEALAGSLEVAAKKGGGWSSLPPPFSICDHNRRQGLDLRRPPERRPAA